MNGYIKTSFGLGLALTMVVGKAQTLVPISPNSVAPIVRMPTTATASTFVPGRVLVKFKPTAALNAGVAARGSLRAQAIASVRASHLRQLRVDGDVAILAVDDVSAAIAQLSSDPAVEIAEPDYLRSAGSITNDPFVGSLWGLSNSGQLIDGTAGTPGADIRAADAWKTTTGTREVVVAVIDSGIALDHPDLAANIWANIAEIPGNGVDDDANGYVDDTRGWNFISNTQSADDDEGHGTHVAGTIAATGNNGTGVVGVAPGVRVMPLKFLSSLGVGTTSDMLEAMQYAARMGAQILNCSVGSSAPSLLEYNLIKQLGTQGVLVIAAAGNESSDNDYSPLYPASYWLNNIISVAASDNRDDAAYFTNYGAHSVHIAAPGQSILSTYPPSGYAFMSGTSMATPHISGIAALTLSRYPQLGVEALREQILGQVRFSPLWSDLLISPGIANASASLRRCVADFDGSGFVDFADFDTFVQAFENGLPSSDTNNDGFLDFSDFDAFVSAFESGCGAPPVPTGLTAALDEDDYAAISWSNPPNSARSLVVESSYDGHTFNIEAVLPSSSTSLNSIYIPELSTTNFRLHSRSDQGTSAPLSCSVTHTLNRPYVHAIAIGTADDWSSFFASLGWFDFSGFEDSYRLAASTDGGAHWNNLAVYPIDTESAPIEGLARDTNYLLKLRAAKGTTFSAYTPTVELLTPPNAPGTLSSCNTWPTMVDLCWSDTNRTETAYRIAMSTDGGANFNNIGETGPDTATFRVTGLNPKTNYIFKVRAQNDTGYSPYSNTISINTPDAAPNGTPSALRIANLWPNALDLAWTDNSTNEDGFRVFFSIDAVNWTEQFPRPGINSPNIRVSNLSPGTRYFIKVRAYNAFGGSPDSPILEVVTPSGLPTAPTSLAATNIWANQADIRWTDNATDESNYRIAISTDGTNFSNIGGDLPANSISYRLSGLTSNKRYWVRVRCSNSFGFSDYSNTLSFTTKK